MQNIRMLNFVLWVWLSLEFWSMNAANFFLGRTFCISQDCNRAIRRLLCSMVSFSVVEKSSLQQRFTLVQKVSYSNQEESELSERQFDTCRFFSSGENFLLILCQKSFYDHSMEASFPAKKISLFGK